MQYQEFIGKWKLKYQENKTKIEKLEQYQKNKNLENSFSILGYITTKIINHYNKVIIYDQQKINKYKNFNQSRHIYFILDVSDSMRCFDEDSNYTSVPKKFKEYKFCDGQ